MKRILAFCLMTAVAVLMVSSCKETLPRRFDAFVNHVEKKCASFSEDDWSKANAQFEKLVQEFQDNKSSYNQEEQKQIRSDIAKYVGLVAKSGLNTVVNAVDELLNQIPSLLEGLGNFLKDLGLPISDDSE